MTSSTPIVLFLLVLPATAQLTSPGETVHWIDCDQDGRDDLLLTRPGNGTWLLRNTGDGRFVDVTDLLGLTDLSGARSVAWSDFDGDRDPDLVAITAAGELALLRNENGAVFVRVEAGSGIAPLDGLASAAWHDFDRDGAPDLMLETATELRLYRNVGQGRFDPLLVDPLRTEPTAALVAPILTEPDGTATPQAPEPAAAPGRSGKQALRTPVAVPATSSSGGAGTDMPMGPGPPYMPVPIPTCAKLLDDVATTLCLSASTVPALGMLYPLSVALNVDAATEDVLIGTTETNSSKLRVEAAAPDTNAGYFDNPGAFFGVSTGSTSRATGAGGLAHIGSIGEASGAAVNYGVQGTASGVLTNYGGYFTASGGTNNWAVFANAGASFFNDPVTMGSSIPGVDAQLSVNADDPAKYAAYFDSAGRGIYARANGTTAADNFAGIFEANGSPDINVGIQASASGAGTFNAAGIFSAQDAAQNFAIFSTQGVNFFAEDLQIGVGDALAYRDTVGRYAEAAGYVFDVVDGQPGILLESGETQSGGFFANGNTTAIWASGGTLSNGPILSVYDTNTLNDTPPVPILEVSTLYASQRPSASGLVKAACHVRASTGVANVVRAFNDIPGGSYPTISRIGVGLYEVDFDVDVSIRYYSATICAPPGVLTSGTILAQPGVGGANRVLVYITDTGGTATDNDFYLVVM